MLTNREKHNAAKFIEKVGERDEDITQAELVAYLKAEGDLLAQYFLLGLGLMAIGTLWLAIL